MITILAIIAAGLAGFAFGLVARDIRHENEKKRLIEKIERSQRVEVYAYKMMRNYYDACHGANKGIARLQRKIKELSKDKCVSG